MNNWFQSNNIEREIVFSLTALSVCCPNATSSFCKFSSRCAQHLHTISQMHKSFAQAQRRELSTMLTGDISYQHRLPIMLQHAQ
jgi:hypothetical protein